MKIIYNKFLIISTIFLLVGGVYLYLSRDLNSGAIVSVAFGSSLASSNGTESSPITPTLGNDIASDISFLTTLVALKQIKIDISLFTNKSFNKLQNNAVKIESVVAGRVNPFAPIDANSIINSGSGQTVITDQPTQITDKTAILNGTINTINGVTDTYFAYGTSAQSITGTTGIVKQSLVGTFIKNVSGLTTKTTYFFKACAKVNNIALCGEVISFTTK
ncbi:MAG: hypothetical protein WC908_03615 [Candidatus Paceibacterota bacterium]